MLSASDRARLLLPSPSPAETPAASAFRNPLLAQASPVSVQKELLPPTPFHTQALLGHQAEVLRAKGVKTPYVSAVFTNFTLPLPGASSLQTKRKQCARKLVNKEKAAFLEYATCITRICYPLFHPLLVFQRQEDWSIPCF